MSTWGASKERVLSLNSVTVPTMRSIGWWSNHFFGSLLLLSVASVLGRITVVSPLQPGDLSSIVTADHGLVLGVCTLYGTEGINGQGPQCL